MVVSASHQNHPQRPTGGIDHGCGSADAREAPKTTHVSRRYDPQLIRLKDGQSQLETDDLDEEERKALAEVAQKLG